MRSLMWLSFEFLDSLNIGLFKMFPRWIWSIFNFQIQSEWGHTFLYLMCHTEVEDLLEIYKCDSGPYCSFQNVFAMVSCQ